MKVTTELGKGIEQIILKAEEMIELFFTDHYESGLAVFQNLISLTGKTLALYLAVWIAIEGYKIAWGNGKQSVQNFMFDAIIKFIFIVLALFVKEWINIVYLAFDGAKTFITSATSNDAASLWTKIALWGGFCGDFTYVVVNKSWFAGIIVAFLVSFICFVGFGIGAIPLMRVLMINTISFLFLMVMMPIAFYTLIFKSTKDIFSQWFQMVLANIFTLMFVYFLVGIVMDYVFKTFGQDTNYAKHSFGIAFSSIIYGIFINIFLGVATSIATQLTRVSIEGIAGSAVGRAMGLAGAMSGAAIGGVALGVKGVQMLGAGKALQGVANFIGSRTAGTAKSTAQLISNSQIGKNTGQVINNGINAAKNSQIGQKMGAGFETARKIGSKINNFTKGGE